MTVGVRRVAPIMENRDEPTRTGIPSVASYGIMKWYKATNAESARFATPDTTMEDEGMQDVNATADADGTDELPFVVDMRLGHMSDEERSHNRRIRAQWFNRMLSEGATYREVADKAGCSRSHVRAERAWYIDRFLGGARPGRTPSKRLLRSIERRERLEAKRQERLERSKRVIDALMSGRTLKDVSSEIGVQPNSLYPIINVWLSAHPEDADRYHKVMATHRFGRFRYSEKLEEPVRN